VLSLLGVITPLQIAFTTSFLTMKKIKITQVKSVIDRPERQKRTMEALGLRKMNATVEVTATAQILGMVEKVHHLVKVEELAN
jgi:large subunit ribosomal protein L30